MSLRLVVTGPERWAIDHVACPREDCRMPLGRACMRSGGAISGGSPQRFGEYLHDERLERGERERLGGGR